MKTFIATLMLMFAASSYAADPAAVKAAEVAKADAAKQAVQNDNCVKKDKNGNALVSMKVNTFEKREQTQSEKDPWE